MKQVEKYFNEIMLIALIAFIPLAMMSCSDDTDLDVIAVEQNDIAHRLIQSASYNLDVESPSETINTVYTAVKCDIKGLWLNVDWGTYWRFGQSKLRIFTPDGIEAGVFKWRITEAGNVELKIEGTWYLFESRFTIDRPNELTLAPNVETRVNLSRVEYPVGASSLAFDNWSNECNEYYN